MALLAIPTETDGTAFYSQRISLEGREYGIDLKYNTRSETWQFSLETESGEKLIEGKNITLGHNLLRRVASPDAPPGGLFAVAQDDVLQRPGLIELGDRVLLIYATSDELA